MGCLLSSDYKQPKQILEPKLMQVGSLDKKGHDQANRVYSINGLSPTITCMGGGGLEPKILQENITNTVVVRKHDLDIVAFQKLLKDHKKQWSNKMIAEELGVPKTTVDHWFRTDNGFSIPDANIWLRLKGLLNIDVSTFDKAVMEFEVRDSKFDLDNRAYNVDGLSPTLTCQGNHKIIINSQVKPSVSKNFQRELDNISACKDDIYYAECKSGFQDNKIELNVSPCLRAGNNATHCLDNNFTIRKLTPLECWRLQGFSDENYYKAKESGVSASQLYKQAGNSITVDVLYYIIQQLHLYFDGIAKIDDRKSGIEQLSLF
jgi:DNA (cytosine-5)-methyltransferase 1